MNATQTSKSKSKTPFCKVCFDAKKPESVYTSHFVKSAPGPDGQIICPTLLNQACRNCGQLGHTSSYCVKATQLQPKFKTASTVAIGGAVGVAIGVAIGVAVGVAIGGAGAAGAAEAELRLISSTFKSKNQKFQEFPSLLSNAEKEKEKEKEESEESHHVYNPKSNPFGALSQKQTTTKRNSSFQQPQPQPAAKPMTMAERLKNPPALPVVPTPTSASTSTHAPRVKFVDLPPKSQFWWQDEDD